MTLSNNLMHKILDHHGPMRASRLAAILSNELNVSPHAATKRISRSSSPIHKISNLLPRNEVFLYNQSDWRSWRYWQHLRRDLREANSIYSLTLDGIQARGGVIQRSSFDVICGAPTAWKKQVPASVVFDKLLSIGLIEAVEIRNLAECIRLRNDLFQVNELNTFRASRLAEDIQMDALREWVRKIGLVSYNAASIRDDRQAPSFGNFYWDLTGPSYLLPLVSRSETKTKPGFFVADVFCDTSLDVPDIQYFLRKVRMLQTRTRGVPFLPLILSDSFTKDSLRLGKQNGVIMATTRNLYGDAVSAALKSLVDTMKRSRGGAIVSPEYIADTFSKLNAIGGLAGNLHKALFELIVGCLSEEIEGGVVKIGEIIEDKETNKCVEIDVLREKGKHELWFYKCLVTGSEASVQKDDVKEWARFVDQTQYVSRKQTQQLDGGRDARLCFEFWTTGQFADDALKQLENEKKSRNNILINWRDGTSIRNYAKKAVRRTILDILDLHYFNRRISEDTQQYSHRIIESGRV